MKNYLYIFIKKKKGNYIKNFNHQAFGDQENTLEA
jgi:hypothetical protein